MGKLEEYQEKRRQQVKRFKAVFGSAQGKAVLKDLREEYYDVEIEGERSAGAHSVIYNILRLIEEV